jgi:hypothetical protein
MSAVRKAEQRINETATTKTYKGVVGNKEFSDAIVELALDNVVDKSRIRCVNGNGGTGALMILAHVLGRARPKGRIFISDPTWPNHWPLAEMAGLVPHYYPYFDAKTRHVDFDAMMEVVDTLTPDDIVLLHGCCHNPTGANLTPAAVGCVTESLKRTGAFPLIDLAYLGFGDGLEEDAYGVRKVVSSVPEAMVAFSASKNFGLYRERAGVAIAIAKDSASADIVSSQMQNVIRGDHLADPRPRRRTRAHDPRGQGTARRVGGRAHRNAGTHEAAARQAGGCDPGALQLGRFRLHRRAFGDVLAARPAGGRRDETQARRCDLHDQRQPHQRRRHPGGPHRRTGRQAARRHTQ